MDWDEVHLSLWVLGIVGVEMFHNAVEGIEETFVTLEDLKE